MTKKSKNQPTIPLPRVWKDTPTERVQADRLVRQYITPEKIVWLSDESGVRIKEPDILLDGNIGQSLMNNRRVCRLQSDGDGMASILFDFSRELHGGLQLVFDISSKLNPARFRIRFGESVGEAMSELGGTTNATNDHAMRDFVITVPRTGLIEVGNTGFRFVRVDLIDPDIVIALKEIRAIFTYKNIPYLGTFRCNDDRLNRIWETAAYTVHLNMQNYLWDGIKRDRLVWIGDMHPEVMAVSAVFGEEDIVPKSLDLIRDETPLPRWMNGICSYSMWWLIIHYQWFLHHGNFDYLKEQQSYLIPLVDQLIGRINNRNEEAFRKEDRRFIDWPSYHNLPAVHAGLHALMVSSLRSAAEMAKYLDDRATQQKCEDAVQKLLRHIPDPNGSKQAAALMALAGVSPADEINASILAKNGVQGVSTFMGYYVLQSRALAGDYQGAIDNIRDYWGAMLDLGATTFWENFYIEDAVNAARIDEIVPEGGHNLVAVDMIVTKIRSVIEE